MGWKSMPVQAVRWAFLGVLLAGPALAAAAAAQAARLISGGD